MKKIIKLSIIPLLLVTMAGCSNSNTTTTQEKNYFELWNDCEVITSLKEYVSDVTNEKSSNFIPKEDRIATFDMDGTILGELYPTYFEYNMLEYRVLDDPEYIQVASESEIEAAQAIRDFVREGEALPTQFDLVHANAAAKAYSGMTLDEFDSYVKEYAKKPANGFTGMTYADSFYKPMLEIFDYLEDNDFTYYIVSGSDRFICRALVDSIGIEPDKVIGMDVELKSKNQGDVIGVNYEYKKTDTLIRTDNLIIKNLQINKVKQIVQEIGKAPVLSFGNSGGDTSMHNYCLTNPNYKSEAFMLIADDDVRDHANVSKAEALGVKWGEAGYHVISMKNDFKTIYGTNVVKCDFTF